MSTTLEEIAKTADEVADDQRRIARRARSMQRLRDRGWSWSRIVDREAEPGVVELLRRSGRKLSRSTARFTAFLAESLSREGRSRRQIAHELGVSHQRVSAMLNGRSNGAHTP